MPEAILLEDVESLGAKGDVVSVSKGYFRNFLEPRKLAAPATKAVVLAAERRAEEQEKAQVAARSQAAELAEVLNRTVLTISQQAGEDGRLFGSVTNKDIADAIKEARGVDVERRKIVLDEPIKSTGTFQVDVEVADGVHATVKTIVTEA